MRVDAERLRGSLYDGNELIKCLRRWECFAIGDVQPSQQLENDPLSSPSSPIFAKAGLQSALLCAEEH